MVNLINHMPMQAYRHAVVAITEVVPAFSARIRRQDVQFHSLHKPAGHGTKIYPQLYRLLRQLRPTVLHTRNLAALECQVPAWLAGVPVRIHGEHGRDIGDLDGTRKRNQWARRLYRPFVQQYVALSADLGQYLRQRVGVRNANIMQIYNGVDTERFMPAGPLRAQLAGSPFNEPGLQVFGTVGRMQPVKDQLLLARAFVHALDLRPDLRRSMRLVMVGDGPLRVEAQAVLTAGRAAELAWLPGERADVPDVMRALDCFVLPSLAEGISNTILEAMSCGLPILATDVGGNGELVSPGHTGLLTPAGDARAMAAAMIELADATQRGRDWGAEGRRMVEQQFSLSAMVQAYQGLYDHLLAEQQLKQRLDG